MRGWSSETLATPMCPIVTSTSVRKSSIIRATPVSPAAQSVGVGSAQKHAFGAERNRFHDLRPPANASVHHDIELCSDRRYDFRQH